MKISGSAIGFIALNILVLAGCPVTGDDLCAGGTCEAIDATSPDAADAGPDGLVVEPRDPCVDKPTAAECITDESAIFVSKNGDPATGDGTLAKPYASVATALRKVTAQKKRVYVCEGTYEEQISIETVASTLIGGLACDFRTPGAKALIKPQSGIALGVAKVGGASVIDIAFEARSDAPPGSSAVAVFVTEAEDILFRGVEITTGVGQPGSDGKNGSETPNHPQPAAQAPQGVGGNSNGTVAAANTCTACVDGTFSKGGSGGGHSPMLILATGGDTSPPVPGRLDNGGGSAGVCGAGLPGQPGEPAAKAAGGKVPGKLEAKSWTDRSTTAENGRNGPPGQGGGGGGVATAGTGGGGSGACGGCGGTGGKAGTDGGSSIGVLVYKSKKIVFERSKIVTAAGGKGGKGGDGHIGQEAATIGGAGGGGGACNGGGGGAGAGGGGGGGGIGGYSVAIAYIGEAPTAPQSELKPGPAGEPGTGGKGGVAVTGGKKGEDGANGDVSKSVELLPLE